MSLEMEFTNLFFTDCMELGRTIDKNFTSELRGDTDSENKNLAVVIKNTNKVRV